MEIIETPHYRYPDWPGKTVLYTDDGGSATLENVHNGSHLFFRSSGQEYDSNACYTYDEALELLRVFTEKVKEMAELHKKYGWDYEGEPVPHQWLGECPRCHACHTEIGEVLELNGVRSE